MGEVGEPGGETARLQRVREIAQEGRCRGDSLIQVLHAVQGSYGYLPVEVQRVVADAMHLPLGTVSGVVTFYSFFSTESMGRHTVRICLGTACYVSGGVRLVDALEDVLRCKVGHTTADGRFRLEVARCIGACSLAPAVSIDDRVYARVSADELPRIISEYGEQDEDEGVAR